MPYLKNPSNLSLSTSLLDKEKEGQMAVLPREPSFPRDTILQWSKLSNPCANFGFIKNIHGHPS